MTWEDLADIAPHTKAVWETIGDAKIVPVLEAVPTWLTRPLMNQGSPDWGDFLNEVTTSGITNRERLLRYLITRSVVDQGSDIVGVEAWHAGTFSTLYAEGIEVFDDLSLMESKYPTILRIADDFRQKVIDQRAEDWASLATNRHAANYTPFMVDGQRGKGNTHWFLTARVFPTLFLAGIHSGGLTELVFGRSASETPKEMARRLRNDVAYKDGLSWVMGDKACDLFAKWAIGSFRLTEGLKCGWTPSDCPIPMDQRIGRLMIRCGFMDEFYGVVGEMSVKSHGFAPKSGQMRPRASDHEIPDGDWFLHVMDFRRNAKVRAVWRRDAREWVVATTKELGRTFSADNTTPQDVVSLLCLSYNKQFNRLLTPVEVDDYFMSVGGNQCTDRDPGCKTCSLRETCQANTAPAMIRLKNCFT